MVRVGGTRVHHHGSRTFLRFSQDRPYRSPVPGVKRKSRLFDRLFRFAEMEGFEPPVGLPPHRISSAARSTTPAHLRCKDRHNCVSQKVGIDFRRFHFNSHEKYSLLPHSSYNDSTPTTPICHPPPFPVCCLLSCQRPFFQQNHRNPAQDQSDRARASPPLLFGAQNL
jgi:hypothetical protein